MTDQDVQQKVLEHVEERSGSSSWNRDVGIAVVASAFESTRA